MEKSELADKDYLLNHWAIKLSTVMIKRDLLNKIGYYFRTDIKIGYDYELCWRAVIASSKIYYIEKPLVKIMLTEDGLSRQNRYIERVHEHLEVMESVIKWINHQNSKFKFYLPLLKERQALEFKNLIKHRVYDGEAFRIIKDLIFLARITSIKTAILINFSIFQSMLARSKRANLSKT